MKRVFVASAIFGLVLLGSPSPANAASDCQQGPLGLVCLSVDDNGVVSVTGPAGLNLSVDDPIVREVTVYVDRPGPTTTLPGQTVTLGPAPAATVTRTVPGPTTIAPGPTTRETITETATSTETATVTNTTGGQTATPSVTLSEESTTPTLAEPPVEQPGSVDLVPDDPKVAAATGSLFGLFAGIILGIAGLYVAYRRGQIDGEKTTLQEFLGVIRGEPAALTGRHRID